MTSKLLLGICALIVVTVPVFPQTSGGHRPAFEVASIKLHVDAGAGSDLVGFQNIPGSPRMDMMGVTFKMLMEYAYAVRDFQILGGPPWLTSERYDIQAKAEDGSVQASTRMRDLNTPDPMALRIQSLLDDRFHLKMHRETRELVVYELTAARGGSKLKLSPDQSPPESASQDRGSLSIQRTPAGWILQASAVPLSSLITVLSNQIGRTIVDKSNVKPGLYDINLQWAPNRPPAEGAPADDPEGLPIFTSVQDQLGLRLVSSKGPVEVLVIDVVQKPSPN
jgi:bla regulator protein blaR1